MITMYPVRLGVFLAATLLLVPALFAAAWAQVPIVQPGAPGETARDLSADEAIEIATNSYSPDDVRFTQDLIPHHTPAGPIVELVGARPNNPAVTAIAAKVEATQADEIARLQG